MHPEVGNTVYCNLEVFVGKPETQAGVFRVEGKHSKARNKAVARTPHPLSLVERANQSEAGLNFIRKENVALINERSGLVYKIEALQQGVSSHQREAEMTMGQLQVREEAGHQH